MERKSSNDKIGPYESVEAIIRTWDTEGRDLIGIELFNDFEDDRELTFGEVLDKCREAGWTGNGTILLILESYMSGKVYRYGNYNDEYWYEVGTMRGFA